MNRFRKMGMSGQVANALARALIAFYGSFDAPSDQEIRRLSDQELLGMRSLGKKTLREIRRFFPYNPKPAPVEPDAACYDYFLERLSA